MKNNQQADSSQPTQKLRDQVASEYQDRIAQTEGKDFAQPSPELGYTTDDLSALPQDAVGSSFGCGNPLAFSYVKPGDTVVDLGSGAGLDLLVARQRTGPTGTVIGIDMTDAMIEKARENIDKAGYDNVEVRKGLIEAMPVDSDSAHWVISNCVVNLSPEKDKVFAEIARVLGPGGEMLISDIVVNDVPTWARRVAGFYNKAAGAALSERDYLAALRRAGLRDVEIRERHVYERDDVASMVDSELGLGAVTLKQRLGRWIKKPLIRAAAGKVVSIRVYARVSS